MQPEPCSFAILIHYGELGLKGRNRPLFFRQLRQNIQKKLRTLGLKWQVCEPQGSFEVLVPAAEEPDIPRAIEGLREVFGIAWLTCARRLRHTLPDFASHDAHLAEIEKALVELAARQFMPEKSFAVRVRRADKNLPFTSTHLDARFGEVIRQSTSWKKVNLKQPDATFHVEIRARATYIFSDRLKGAGGLPVGTAGRVLVLLSGGIDSPVAAYLIAKRGCRVDFIHFTASSITPDQAREEKIWRLVQQVNRYTMGSTLHVVPYTYFDFATLESGVQGDLVLFRRFIARAAQQLAKKLKCEALVSGDNLSQVASQTLSNLVTTSRAIEFPILRPLLTYDKEDIINLARQIGTYELSIEPYKDCCALVTRNPRITSTHERMTALERGFQDYQKVIDQTLADALEMNTEEVEPLKTIAP